MRDADERLIYHMTPQAMWDAQRGHSFYTAVAGRGEGFHPLHGGAGRSCCKSPIAFIERYRGRL